MSGAPRHPPLAGGTDRAAGDARRLTSEGLPSPPVRDELCAAELAGTDATPAVPAVPGVALVVPTAPLPDAAGAPPDDAPIGSAPADVATWFDEVADAAHPENDGSLAAAHAAARAWSRRAKAANTREAYRWAVRAWCAWCDRHGVSPLPSAGADVAAFLAGERDRGLAPATLDIRRAAIAYLHRAAGCPVPPRCSAPPPLPLDRHAKPMLHPT